MGSTPDPREGQEADSSDAPPAGERYDVVRQLFREHNRALVSFLLTRVSSEQEALDLAQEAYVKLLQLDSFGAVSFLRGYLFRIAANLSVDRVRSRGVREKAAVQLFEDVRESEALEVQAITREEFERACGALNELSPKHREAFVRHIVEGYSTAEVSTEFGIDERTVRKYVARALAHCRQRLGGHDPETGA